MSEENSKEKILEVPKAHTVAPIPWKEGDSSLHEEPIHIINEIIANTNAFVGQGVPDLSALLYLGSAQRYAMRFVNPQGIVDPMNGTFAGIPVIWVDVPYHVNLVAKRNDPKPT